MIPHYLEKAILMGWATYQKVSHSFGMFGEIKIPNNCTVIITDLKWFPFLNPIKEWQELSSMTWREWFKYNEYQLKIDGKNSVNFLQFRNEFDYKFTFPNNDTFSFKLDENINTDYFYNYLLPIQKEPIIQNVYFICEEFIKLTISRNALAHNISTDFTLLNNHANEEDAPNGVKDILVSNKLTMTSLNGSVMDYLPPLVINAANPPTNSRNTEPYVQDLNILDSRIQNPDSNFTQSRCDFPYHTNPLVELGMVVIRNQFFDKLQNQ